MRITDRSPQGRRLQTIFFPAEPRPVMPTEVSDEIVLVHPAAPPMVGFKENQFFFQEVLGTLGVANAQSTLVPTDRYWWVQMLEIFHSDAASRTLRIAFRDSLSNEASIVQGSAAVGAGVRLVFERPFLLPNDTRFIGLADGMAAGARLTLRFFFLEFLHAEINPAA